MGLRSHQQCRMVPSEALSSLTGHPCKARVCLGPWSAAPRFCRTARTASSLPCCLSCCGFLLLLALVACVPVLLGEAV